MESFKTNSPLPLSIFFGSSTMGRFNKASQNKTNEGGRTCAVASVRSQGEAGLADALEAAVLIDAHAVQAHVGRGALVVIWGHGRGSGSRR